ncbi:MAG: MBL fold metallo-hydrolase [Eubacteriales bacterium]|nr:MBL fold metallo-hydrolase [Eubacteriales bacterium]MDD3350174.1 MBL fold metallo-hydrolase [Eubacteriales bacterium]
MRMKRFVGGNLESNGYLIYDPDTKKGYIVDPGYQAPRFLKEMEALKIELNGILLTHHHYDHVGAVEAIVKATGCPVYLHRSDCDMYQKPVTHMLEDGQIIDFPGDELRVVHTPGHTHGSVCFYSEKSKLCFTGDTIFNVDLGRTDLADGSDWEMERSVRDKIALWENDITIYPGHGDAATMKYVRKCNLEFLQLLK